MSLPRNDTSLEQLTDSDAVTTVSFASIVTIDDSWLEAVLDHLALAKLPRLDGVSLLHKLEEFEHDMSPPTPATKSSKPQYPIVVGDHFDAELNAYDMRAPDAMTADNVLDTIERAARYFAVEGHAAALRQLVFFISGNIEEVLAEEDEETE